MSVIERNLQQICIDIINIIPNNDNNKEKFKSHINSILRTYLYSAPEIKVESWVRVQNLLQIFYSEDHPSFDDINKVWNNTN